MEFGPRALGGRSILGDPRSEKMQKNLNLKIKYRESFRPFAPSVLKEDLSQWFNMNDNWSRGSAYSIILLIVSVIFVLTMMRIFKVRIGEIIK